MKKLNINLSTKEIHYNPKPLLKICLSRYFSTYNPNGFVTMIINHIKSPIINAENKINQTYLGNQTSNITKSMKLCNSNDILMANVVKLYNTPDGSKFLALARIYSGTITKGQIIRVLGENYSIDDEEDMTIQTISNISISIGRFSIEINQAIAGNIVLIEGIDNSIKKTATLTNDTIDLNEIDIFKSLRFNNKSIFKLAIEPLNPSDLPKMIDSLRKINKSYPLVTIKVEESGEHIIIGTGELYLDCIMYDIRHLYSDIEVKISDPIVIFMETCIDTSIIQCYSETTNKLNKISMIAESLDKGLSNDIELNNISLINNDKKTISDFFMNKYDWDLLSSHSIWAFGPNDNNPNILLNDVLPSSIKKELLNNVKDNIIQGFKWGCREGPLCDEPIYNVKFKLLDATIANEAIYRGGGQIIPAARRSIYSSFLLANPRLMEPIYLCEMQCPADCVQAIYPVLARRRGHVVQDMPKPGAPFYTVKAYIPVIDRLVQSKLCVIVIMSSPVISINCLFNFESVLTIYLQLTYAKNKNIDY